MAFIPLDTVPRARFTKAQFQDYNEEKGWWDANEQAMRHLVDGYQGGIYQNSSLEPIMAEMSADLERLANWRRELQAAKDAGDFMGAVPVPPPLPKPKHRGLKQEV